MNTTTSDVPEYAAAFRPVPKKVTVCCAAKRSAFGQCPLLEKSITAKLAAINLVLCIVSLALRFTPFRIGQNHRGFNLALGYGPVFSKQHFFFVLTD